MQDPQPLSAVPPTEVTDSWRPTRPDCEPPEASEATPTVRRSGSGGGRQSRSPILAILPRPGDRLEEYELIDTIGIGGMGAVFRALDLRLERLVALKVLPLETDDATDAEVVQRFHQEGRAAARLDHESIARVYALGCDQGFHFIAFEFIEGTNLRQLVEERGPLTTFEAIHYSLQIATALVHSAQRGVVHRDIKPSNIIVTPQGRAKLVDMGLARRFERSGGGDPLTQTGMTLGTFDYISPEQARDPRDVDIRSDLYSLGCTMFHMVTGRPPFAEGTVLQKLLQHQEEPPPDVREFNPAVPPELAMILRKLMAKDRNRRYQSPEQLGQALINLAVNLGLRVPGAENFGWATPPPSRGRIHPLVWVGGTAVVTALLVVGIWVAWQGSSQRWPWSSRPAESAARPEERSIRGSLPLAETPDAESIEVAQEQTAPEPDQATLPRTFTVSNGVQLTTALYEAAAGSTIELVGDGPFELGQSLAVPDRNLMIRAADGSHPVLRLLRSTNGRRSSEGSQPILHFAGGRIILEGLEFNLDTTGREETVTGILAENVDLLVQRCSFRRQSHWLSPGRAIGLELRWSPGLDGVPSVRVQSSGFEGNLTGLVARGPVDLRVSDALFGLSFPAVRLERAGADRTQPATIDLRHVSVLASDGPVFRLDGPAPRVRVENSVFAAADRPFLLVMADDPGRLDWSGRENLYGRVASFLQLTGDDPEFPPIQRYSAWANDPDQPREFGSMATDAHVWFEDRPSDSLLGADPERAFRLVSLEGRLTKLGARQGPYGPVPAPLPASIRSDPGSVLAQESIRPVSPSAAPAEATSPNGLHPPGNVHPTPPPNGETPYTVMTEVAKGESPSSTAAASQPPASEPSVPAQRPGPTSLMPKEVEHNEPLELEEPIVVGTSAAFLDELHRLSPQGGTILIAGGTMLSLPVCEFRGEGRWKLKSERKVGENRPILMFDPKTIDGQERGVSSVWKSLFRLREGAVLQVEGIDVVLPFDPAQTNRPFAAFGIAPGTDLELIDCTVTMEGRTRPVRSATVAVRPWDDEVEAGVAANPIHSREAVVRVSDGFFRGGDDFIDVAAGRQLSLSLRNVVVSVGGVFLRGHGLARGLLASPARLGVDLRQVSCFTGNGLVHLQTVPGDSDMPVADIVARDSIVAVTDSAVPLFRVDGQEDQPHPINPIRWEGHGVAYHGVEIYRQDQSTPLGGLTVKFDRPAWQNVVGLKDEAPVHDDVHFVNPIRPGQSAWSVTRDQVRLADDTPAPRAGVDLERIPSPPSTN